MPTNWVKFFFGQNKKDMNEAENRGISYPFLFSNCGNILVASKLMFYNRDGSELIQTRSA